jgi:phosphoglycerate dehydrogenase-like enzyme
MKIVIHGSFWNPFWAVPEQQVENIQQIFPQIDFLNIKNPGDVRKGLSDAEAYFGYRLDPEQIASAKKLGWIHVPAANVFGLDLALLRERGITLTNSRGLHAIPIAEHVIGMMIVFSRRFKECWDFQRRHHYGQKDLLGSSPGITELRNKTAYILGLGSIGKEIARLCKAFGMRVLASKRRSSAHEENVDQLYVPENFREGLPQADYVVISMARTPGTEGLLGQEELSLLKKECVLINVARAAIIQQAPFIDALKKGKIRGAALDVYEQEPLPSGSELFKLKNVFLTPHIAGVNTHEHWDRMFALFVENVRRFINGETLLNQVDLETGY